jgi:hypothetical protein
MNPAESKMIFDAFHGAFFAIGRMAKILTEDQRTNLVGDMLMRINDPTCPEATQRAVREIIAYMQD